MPFKSEKQRKYLHANEPELAQSWERKYGGMKKQKDTAKAIRKGGFKSNQSKSKTGSGTVGST